MSSGNSHNRKNAIGGNGKSGKAGERSKEFFPFRWLQCVLRHSQREDAQRSEYRNYNHTPETELLNFLRLTDTTWQRFAAAILTASGMIFIAGIVACATLYWTGVIVDDKGKLDPNGIIAVFTVVMALTTLLQWQRIGESNREFVTQNDIMKDQISHMREQTAHMVAQGKQTDRMIEMQQRAWIAASINASAGNFARTKAYLEPVTAIIVRNEGETPAVIIHSFVSIEFPCQQSLEYMEHRARSQPRSKICVAPDDMLVFRVSDYRPNSLLNFVIFE